MSHSYDVVFTKYTPCTRIMSAPQHIQAESFEAAYDMAAMRMAGMVDADPEPIYEIASIIGTGYSGEQAHYTGLGIFDISEEKS